MELERMIICYVLDSLCADDVAELKVNLMTALKLIDNLSPWDAEKALKVMFGGEVNAE